MNKAQQGPEKPSLLHLPTMGFWISHLASQLQFPHCEVKINIQITQKKKCMGSKNNTGNSGPSAQRSAPEIPAGSVLGCVTCEGEGNYSQGCFKQEIMCEFFLKFLISKFICCVCWECSICAHVCACMYLSVWFEWLCVQCQRKKPGVPYYPSMPSLLLWDRVSHWNWN